jgi:Fe-S cluster assembly protein SufD
MTTVLTPTSSTKEEIFGGDYARFSQGIGPKLLNVYPLEVATRIQKLRSQARERWLTLDVPTSRNEKWKYTSPKPFLEVNWYPEQTGVAALSVQELEQIPFLNLPCAARLVFIDGFISKSLSQYSESSALDVFPLSEIWASEDPQHRSLVEQFSTQETSHLQKRQDFFATLNSCSLREAALVRISPQKVIEAPILIIFVSTEHSQQSGSARLNGVQPRVVVNAQAGSKANVFEVHTALDRSKSASNSVSNLNLEENATLVYCRLQNQSLNDLHLAETQVRVGPSSRFESYEINLGAASARQSLHVSLAGERAEAVIDGLYLPVGTQHLAHHTTIEHEVPHTTSEQLYKGILGDHGRAVFSGKICIRQNAQKSNSSQLNQNLLLSSTAEVDTKPELQIDADDVKASHGATVGQLDPESIFYLESRAIDRNDAIQILASGFAQDVVERVPHQQLRNELRKVVAVKLSQMAKGVL